MRAYQKIQSEIFRVTKIIKKALIKNRRLSSTARHENEVKNAFLLTVQKFKVIKTTWLSFSFKYCVEGLEK